MKGNNAKDDIYVVFGNLGNQRATQHSSPKQPGKICLNMIEYNTRIFLFVVGGVSMRRRIRSEHDERLTPMTIDLWLWEMGNISTSTTHLFFSDSQQAKFAFQILVRSSYRIHAPLLVCTLMGCWGEKILFVVEIAVVKIK